MDSTVRSYIIRSSWEWLTFPPRASSAHCASASEGAWWDIKKLIWSHKGNATYDDDWDTHEPQKLTAFFVVFPRHFDLPPTKTIQVFRGSRLLCFLSLLFCLFSLFETFCELDALCLATSIHIIALFNSRRQTWDRVVCRRTRRRAWCHFRRCEWCGKRSPWDGWLSLPRRS